jgi:RNA recognition motif-containing protein
LQQAVKEKKMLDSKLYVGNFSYFLTKEDLGNLFSSYGEIKDVNVIEGKGFGFVEMSNPAEAEKAKAALNGSEFKGRILRVDEARPRNFNGGAREGYRRY